MKRILLAAAILGLVCVSPVKSIDLFDGWYWNSNESGWGVNIEVQGNVMFIAIFTYRSNGQPVWYYGAAPFSYDDGVFQTNMSLASGGSCFSCPYQEPDFGEGEGGAITIDFDAPGGIEITWKGRKTTLQRQFWAFGEPNDFLFGYWGLIRGISNPFADWYVLNSREVDNQGESFVAGNALGNSIVVAEWFPNSQSYAMLDGKTTGNWFYEFVMTKETMIGSYWILDAGENPVGSGTEFVANRIGQQEIPVSKTANTLLWDLERSLYGKLKGSGSSKLRNDKLRLLQAKRDSLLNSR